MWVTGLGLLSPLLWTAATSLPGYPRTTQQTLLSSSSIIPSCSQEPGTVNRQLLYEAATREVHPKPKVTQHEWCFPEEAGSE